MSVEPMCFSGNGSAAEDFLTLLKKAPKAASRSRCCWLGRRGVLATSVGFGPFCVFSRDGNDEATVEFEVTGAIGRGMAGAFWLGQPAILLTLCIRHFQNPIIGYCCWLFCCP